jgi:predicted lipase
MFDKQFAINIAIPAAQAAYDIMLGNITLPLNYKLVGLIDTDTKIDPDPKISKILASGNTWGYIARDSNSTIVAIRGTETLKDWLEDFDAILVPSRVGMIHYGFNRVYQHIKPSIFGQLHSNIDEPYYIIGHSLGAAVAGYLAYDYQSVPTIGYTFGEPRGGDSTWASNFNRGVPNWNRVVNHGDIVPGVPLWPFKHKGTATAVKGGFHLDDISYAHHLTTYDNGLKELAA